MENFFENIIEAVDGDDGYDKYMEYYEANSNYFDIVVSDITMPKMDGIVMCKLILEQNKKQPILIVSAHNESEKLQELIHLGISHFIHKPIKVFQLSSALSEIVQTIKIQRQEAEEIKKIETLNHELDALVNSFDTYVIASRTDLKGIITYASKAYENISGYTKEELLGKPHNLVRHPDMPKEAFQEMWDTIQAGKLWIGEVKNLKKDGNFYWVEAYVAPYYDASKKHIGYSAIRLDITSKKRAELLNIEIINLLNNAGQGFLSFDKNLKINESFSKECMEIFDTLDIGGKDISEILFENDSTKKELFAEAIENVLNLEETMLKEMMLSLLPHEHHLNNKDVTLEYKLLPNDSFMLILTDITEKKQLEEQIKTQNQIHKMIVSIVSNKNDFAELKLHFENFLIDPPKDLKTLLRELHTFKGVFAQKELINIVDAIHGLETKINKMVEDNQSKITLILDTFYRYDLNKFFQVDLGLVEEALGKEFLEANHMLNIETSLIDSLELKIKRLESKETHDFLEEILSDLKQIRSESVMQQLNVYPIAVKQIAQKLEKEVYPLEIIGEQTLKVPSEFKPFLKSLIHLFNNCVEHGIEDIETRILHNKDEIGTIECSYSLDNGNLQIIIKDDGGGIDIEKLSKKALENNIKTKEELVNFSNDAKLLLIFADSLSTKDEVSTTAGRGIGMGAIKAECEKLNGTINIKSNIGIGTEFIFTIPLNKEN